MNHHEPERQDTRISVAIPVFNRAEWIGQTLDHIFSQTVPVDEVVLCDDGSTDDLETALVPYRDRVRLVRIENSGPAIARKTAIEHTTCEWVALCDSDDYWERDHIECFMDAWKAFPDINLYFSDFRTSDCSDQTKFEQAPEGWLERLCEEPMEESRPFYRCRRPFLAVLLDFQACFQSCLVFRRSLYDELGGIRPHVARWPSEDFHLTARMAVAARAAIGTRSTVLIHKHPDNFSSDYVRNLEGEVRILMDLHNEDSMPGSSIPILERGLTKFRIGLFRAYYWDGQYQNASILARKIPFNHFRGRDWARRIISIVKARAG